MSAVSILAQAEARALPNLRDQFGQEYKGFNPRPGRSPGAAFHRSAGHVGKSVSILAQAEARALLSRGGVVGKRECVSILAQAEARALPNSGRVLAM